MDTEKEIDEKKEYNPKKEIRKRFYHLFWETLVVICLFIIGTTFSYLLGVLGLIFLVRQMVDIFKIRKYYTTTPSPPPGRAKFLFWRTFALVYQIGIIVIAFGAGNFIAYFFAAFLILIAIITALSIFNVLRGEPVPYD